MGIPTRYWITSGVGESDVSQLVAMDKAYMNCGIGYQNQVIVSSIPPVERINPQIQKDQGITFVQVNNDLKMIPFSEIIYVVRAIKSGTKDEVLCSSISLTKITTIVEGEEHQCLLAYESTGTDLKNTELESLAGLIDMVQERNAVVDESWGNDGYETISSSLTVSKEYGCSVVFVVFDPFTYKP
ncbi:MAG: pyruvoyl-dependent arginine decarboxylase [Candidatus Heimdallarchaeaceae archaeon]